VLEYKFPGHPAPPLGLMFKICSSIESWLDADQRNIAIVHCLTGKGRTAVVLACALTWIGEFNSPMEALTYIAERKSSSIDILTIPSQRRYIQYFSNVLDGVRPRGEPLLLRRIIMNGIPRYGDSTSDPSHTSAVSAAGCCPYIQLFKNGKILANGLIASSPSSTSGGNKGAGTPGTVPSETTTIRWLNCSEGSVSFQIDCIVQGDLLLRCRHHDPSTGARVSMFRAAFHTGYVPSGVLRLTKAQLDGPNHDDRYGPDFFIDLIFAPVDKSDQNVSSDGLSASSASSSSSASMLMNDLGTKITDQTLTDKFEQMFHRDIRFWETISVRKLKTKRRTSRKFHLEVSEKFSILDEALHQPNNSKRSNDLELEDGIEVHFTSQGSFEVDGVSGGTGGGVSELSDDELIKQLTEAADNVDLDYSSEKDKKKTARIASVNKEIEEQAAAAPIALAPVTIETKGEGEEEEEEDFLAMLPKPKEAKPISMLSSPPIVSSARAELQALEDLEKELGLDLSSSTSPPAQSNGTTSHSRVDDNLDDLEDFLESLNK
jgi:hypothetical protein